MGFIDFTSKFFNRSNQHIETEEAIERKRIFMDNVEKTKKIEKQLANQKFIEKKSKLDYQHSCPHRSIIPIKNNNQSNTGTFNDYVAKCEICEAQLWNKSRSISYLYALVDLLNKFPKVRETIKLAGIESDEDNEIFNQIFSLSKDLIDLKDRINDMIIDKDFNEILKSKYNKNKVKED